MKNLLVIIADVHIFLLKLMNRFFMIIYKAKFASAGKNVKFFPLNSSFSYSTIDIGNDVYIGPGACFSSITNIKLGNDYI